ncbi:hypothetical protein BDV98DRAFT_583370 [Pterulicium gracile]|uniref:Uncharacterized protein n=1 Tax=Pterulicium gracile TaxID=1884261 RepID=A0A5C3QGB3_9AGAR|nr:hypothetical protein BDV98DRAFT_583370 [Pterula gracilis]
MARRAALDIQVEARVAPKSSGSVGSVENDNTKTPTSPLTPKPALLISTPAQGPFSTLASSGDDAGSMHHSVPPTPSLADMIHSDAPALPFYRVYLSNSPRPEHVAVQPSSQESTISIDAVHTKHSREETKSIAGFSGGMESPKRVKPPSRGANASAPSMILDDGSLNPDAFPASSPAPQTPRGQHHRDKPRSSTSSYHLSPKGDLAVFSPPPDRVEAGSVTRTAPCSTASQRSSTGVPKTPLAARRSIPAVTADMTQHQSLLQLADELAVPVPVEPSAADFQEGGRPSVGAEMEVDYPPLLTQAPYHSQMQTQSP